ncbi:hypothetical protein BOO34_16380 [Vibrio navarrensis]|nr:hypothetical protein [Vibrio navarrensis]MBE4587902.1 hypothetical protein [Vibrio navarrensis]
MVKNTHVTFPFLFSLLTNVGKYRPFSRISLDRDLQFCLTIMCLFKKILVEMWCRSPLSMVLKQIEFRKNIGSYGDIFAVNLPDAKSEEWCLRAQKDVV